jgi:hypothetical protein
MLRPETEKLFKFLSHQPGMGGFVLIGGSALSLRIHHRLSEDLDLAYQDLQLPRRRLAALFRTLEGANFHLRRADDPSALFEFEAAGQDLLDYQQDILVNERVKLTFFTPDQALSLVLEPVAADRLRVATLDELFASKTLVCAARSLTRDWFDLHNLIAHHGYTLGDMKRVFEKVRDPRAFDLALQRLCSGRPQTGDPGLAALLPANAGLPSPSELAEFFTTKRTTFEIEEAARAASAKLQRGQALKPPPNNENGMSL